MLQKTIHFAIKLATTCTTRVLQKLQKIRILHQTTDHTTQNYR